jgi:RNA polymerase primary sigma factor
MLRPFAFLCMPLSGWGDGSKYQGERPSTVENLTEGLGIKRKAAKIVRLALESRSVMEMPEDPVTREAMEVEDKNTPSPDAPMMEAESGIEVEQILGFCSDLEQQVLRMRFGIGAEPKTLKEVGEALGLTRTEVSDVEFNALSRLRKKVRS